MTWQESATWATYLAIIMGVSSFFFITRVSHDALKRHTVVLVSAWISIYMGLFFFDTSYFFFGLSLENWSIWRRNFARWSYALVHTMWLLSLVRAYRHEQTTQAMTMTTLASKDDNVCVP